MSENCPRCGSSKDESNAALRNGETCVHFNCLSRRWVDGREPDFDQHTLCAYNELVLGRMTIHELRAELAAEKAMRKAAEARVEGLLQHLQHLVDDLDQMCPDSIWSGWWEKTLALLAPAPEQEGKTDG